MGYYSNPIFTAFLACFMACLIMARPLNSKSTLMARLKLDGKEGSGSLNCWESLFQLQSCTGEVLLFFMNGETYLGPGCCSAIQTIEHQCWPSMLGSLGFTSQEGDILRGYCDASGSVSAPLPPALPHTMEPNATIYLPVVP